MANSVHDLLTKCGLYHDGVVRWRQAVPEHKPGVYIVSTHSDPHSSASRLSGYEANYAVLDQLKVRYPAISVDGAIASPEQVATRISQFWIPATTVLYVGLAGTSLKNRVAQFYTTKIGAAKPHAGGWWLVAENWLFRMQGVGGVGQ